MICSASNQQGPGRWHQECQLDEGVVFISPLHPSRYPWAQSQGSEVKCLLAILLDRPLDRSVTSWGFPLIWEQMRRQMRTSACGVHQGSFDVRVGWCVKNTNVNRENVLLISACLRHKWTNVCPNANQSHLKIPPSPVRKWKVTQSSFSWSIIALMIRDGL